MIWAIISTALDGVWLPLLFVFLLFFPGQFRAHSTSLVSDYLGSQSRAHFEAYVEFHLPLIELFFDRQWRPTDDYEKYVRRRDVFRAEKPFTLLLELTSHLFFYVRDVPYFGLHYDGFYAVDECRTRLARLSALPAIRCAA